MLVLVLKTVEEYEVSVVVVSGVVCSRVVTNSVVVTVLVMIIGSTTWKAKSS